MAPVGSEYNEAEMLENAVRELGVLLADLGSSIEYTIEPNPDRKFWQFWKDKYIAVRYKGDEDE